MGRENLVIDPKTGKLAYSWQVERQKILDAGGPSSEQAQKWRAEDKKFERDFKLSLFANQGRRPGNPIHPISANRLLRENEAKQRAEEAREDRIAEKIARRLRGR